MEQTQHKKPTADHSPLYTKGHGKNEKIGVVLCHGFTGSPHSMRPWAEYLHDQGYTIRMPLLSGHGTSWEDLGNTSWTQWYKEIRDEVFYLNDRCSSVFVAGLSMGGALALKVASEVNVDGVMIVNPGLIIEDPRRHISSIMRFIIPSVPGIGSDVKKQSTYEGAYERVSVKAAHQLKKLFAATRKNLSHINVPILLFRSTEDHVVSDRHIKVLKKKISSHLIKTVELTNSYHVATLDYDAPEIFKKSDQFIQSIVSQEQ